MAKHGVYEKKMCDSEWSYINIPGASDIIQIATDREKLFVLDSEGVLRRIEQGRVSKEEYFINNKIKIKQIACGARHILALTENGNVYA